MLNKNIVSFLGCDAEYDEARVVLFGEPFDSTTSFRREPGLRVRPYEATPGDLRLTVRIRTGI